MENWSYLVILLNFRTNKSIFPVTKFKDLKFIHSFSMHISKATTKENERSSPIYASMPLFQINTDVFMTQSKIQKAFFFIKEEVLNAKIASIQSKNICQLSSYAMN